MPPMTLASQRTFKGMNPRELYSAIMNHRSYDRARQYEVGDHEFVTTDFLTDGKASYCVMVHKERVAYSILLADEELERLIGHMSAMRTKIQASRSMITVVAN